MIDGFKIRLIHQIQLNQIEEFWGIIKPRIKRKNPASIEEVKKLLIVEWSSIPQNLIQNLCKNYLDRIKKVFELKSQRIEPEDLNL